MNQASVRELFSSTASSGEPPLGSLISDSLQAGGRLRRRRRLQYAAAGLAVIAVIAAGVPALSGKLGHPGAGSRATAQAAGARGRHAAASPAGQLPGGFRLVTPVVPAQARSGPYVKDTRQSVAQLMLDGLPRGTQVIRGTLLAGLSDTGQPTCSPGPLCFPQAQVNLRADGVSTQLAIQLNVRAQGPSLGPCALSADEEANNIACKTYAFPGGFAVQEYLQAAEGSGYEPGISDYMFGVTAQWAHGSSVQVWEYPINAAGAAPGFALTEQQLIHIAVDPRWGQGFTMPESFVHSARNLAVTDWTPAG